MSEICCNDCDKYINIYDTTNNYCLECFQKRMPSHIRIMKWFNNEKMFQPLQFNNDNIILKHKLDLYSDTDTDTDSEDEN